MLAGCAKKSQTGQPRRERTSSELTCDLEALLFLDAEDHVWTAGRQALQALGVILGVEAGVATGMVVIPQLNGPTATFLSLRSDEST